MTEPKTKGAATREMLLWHDRRYGHAATVALCDRIPPHLLGMLDLSQPALGVLSATWYPISLTYPMLDRALEQYGGGEGRELAAAINRDLVPKMIHGIYRVILLDHDLHDGARLRGHGVRALERRAHRLRRSWCQALRDHPALPTVIDHCHPPSGHPGGAGIGPMLEGQ
ncbi:MAG TPA: hypothetical protein VF765_26025 [Polyangiaceae bacterium]